jgi:GH43 family beta-xylosidase
MLLIVGLLGLLAWETFCEPFTNPLKRNSGSDPWITYYNGYYYLLTTMWTEVTITRAKTLNGLKTGQTKAIYKQNGGDRCCNVWAPGMCPFIPQTKAWC